MINLMELTNEMRRLQALHTVSQLMMYQLEQEREATAKMNETCDRIEQQSQRRFDLQPQPQEDMEVGVYALSYIVQMEMVMPFDDELLLAQEPLEETGLLNEQEMEAKLLAVLAAL
jgi:hypothetical protein